jgi:hypothetical protein
MGYVIKWDPAVRDVAAPIALTKTPPGPRAEHRMHELALLSEQIEAAQRAHCRAPYATDDSPRRKLASSS